MLSFDIRSLESQAAHVDARLALDDPVWEEGDVRPTEPIQVQGRLSAAGSSRFYFSGRISGTSDVPCRRCLENVHAAVDEEQHFIFSSDADDASDDPDVYPFDPGAHVLDLRPAVREAWLLAAPGYVLCREDCKGICPTCGTDRNANQCDCAPVAADRRWDALRAVRDERP